MAAGTLEKLPAGSLKRKRMTTTEKYQSLKKQTENAGMKVTEKNGKLIVSKKKKKS